MLRRKWRLEYAILESYFCILCSNGAAVESFDSSDEGVGFYTREYSMRIIYLDRNKMLKFSLFICTNDANMHFWMTYLLECFL